MQYARTKIAYFILNQIINFEMEHVSDVNLHTTFKIMKFILYLITIIL